VPLRQTVAIAVCMVLSLLRGRLGGRIDAHCRLKMFA
jgi:hypothetical protein